ncbi:MAG TPA: HAD family phosphatase [Pseudonocardiaceae bacterium]|nr:HAD family phosphatase [Pseudonocardiaceae bacterium]
MAIRAVVFDIGGVLEIVAESSLLGDWATRLGDVWAGGVIGTVTEEQVHAAISERMGVSRDRTDELMNEMWAWYLGVANTELIEYLRALRPRYRTGLLSNSFVGAREREQEAYGYAELVDDIVYSHEVGMSKPEPAIYRLTCDRLGVRPDETVFVDDVPANIEAAREVGMIAIEHRDNEDTIAQLRAALHE